jgi:hypothetical protein
VTASWFIVFWFPGYSSDFPNCLKSCRSFQLLFDPPKEIYAEPNGEDIDEAIKTLIQETDFAHLLPSTVEHSLFKKPFVERIKYHFQIFLAKGHIERIKQQLKRTTAFQVLCNWGLADPGHGGLSPWRVISMEGYLHEAELCEVHYEVEPRIHSPVAKN